MDRARQHPSHKAYKRWLATEYVPCWECGNRASIPDHQPPLIHMTERAWHAAGGTYRPHCTTCSNRQGAHIRNSNNQRPSRQW